MKAFDNDIFNQAVLLANKGDKLEAYRQLKYLLTIYPNEVNVLLWTAFTAPELSESIRLIDLARVLAPTNEAVVGASAWLDQQKRLATDDPTLPTSRLEILGMAFVSKMPLWKVGLGLAALVVVVTLVATLTGGVEYLEYESIDEIINKAAAGEHIRLQVKLTPNQILNGEKYDSYFLQGFDSGSGLILRFPKEGKARPSRRATFYYFDVPNPSRDDNNYVIGEVKRTDIKEAEELIPSFAATQIKINRVTRTDYHPTLGASAKSADRWWIVVEFEMRVSVDDPRTNLESINNDIEKSRLKIVPNARNSAGRISYKSLKSRVEGKTLIISGQIVGDGPLNWQSLNWVGLIGQTVIDIPLKL